MGEDGSVAYSAAVNGLVPQNVSRAKPVVLRYTERNHTTWLTWQ